MTTMLRDGGTRNVRPDRVYRTGVLTPIVGYQPQMAVQNVAQMFTQGPPLGTMLNGLGSSRWGARRMSCCCNNACTTSDETCCYGGGNRLQWGMRGLNGTGWDGLKARVRAFFDRFRSPMIAPDIMAIANTSPGPASMEASMVAPQMQSQMAMLAQLTQGANAGQAVGPLAAGMYALQNGRGYSYYRAR